MALRPHFPVAELVPHLPPRRRIPALGVAGRPAVDRPQGPAYIRQVRRAYQGVVVVRQHHPAGARPSGDGEGLQQPSLEGGQFLGGRKVGPVLERGGGDQVPAVGLVRVGRLVQRKPACPPQFDNSLPLPRCHSPIVIHGSSSPLVVTRFIRFSPFAVTRFIGS